MKKFAGYLLAATLLNFILFLFSPLFKHECPRAEILKEILLVIKTENIPIREIIFAIFALLIVVFVEEFLFRFLPAILKFSNSVRFTISSVVFGTIHGWLITFDYNLIQIQRDSLWHVLSASCLGVLYFYSFCDFREEASNLKALFLNTFLHFTNNLLLLIVAFLLI